MAKDWRENEDRVHSEKYDPGHVVHRLLGRWRDLSAHYQRPESLFWALPQAGELVLGPPAGQQAQTRLPASSLFTWF